MLSYYLLHFLLNLYTAYNHRANVLFIILYSLIYLYDLAVPWWSTYTHTQTMLLTRQCVWSYRWIPAALAVSLLFSSTVTLAHSTTVEHDFHIVHNVDNRSKLTFLYCMDLTSLCVFLLGPWSLSEDYIEQTLSPIITFDYLCLYLIMAMIGQNSI